MIINKDILFYDIETYLEDTIIVFLNLDKSVFKVYHNSFEGLSEVIDKYQIVGFNNYHFDDHIITAIIEGTSSPRVIKAISNSLIMGRKYYASKRINSLDVRQELPTMVGLKTIAAFKGRNIHETSIGFDIDRKLTTEETQAEISYCVNDVKETIDIFMEEERQNYFTGKSTIIGLIGGDVKRVQRWNTTTLVGNLFANGGFTTPRVNNFIDGLDVPTEISSFWKGMLPKMIENSLLPKNLRHKYGKALTSYTYEDYGNKIVFGFGGLHGDNKQKITRTKSKKLYHVDFASMHPSIIGMLGILGSHTKTYMQIKEDRVKLKVSDPAMADGYKLILNKTFGILNNCYSPLFSPMAMYMVTLKSQEIVYKLGKMLSQFGIVTQVNTDGVYVYADVDLEGEIRKASKILADQVGFQLDVDTYDFIFQRDVNSYLTIQEDGSYKAKGTLKRHKGDQYYSNSNSLGIIQLAIVEKIANNKDILDTIIDNLDRPILYQYIFKAGSSYLGIFDNDGNQVQKINRGFATTEGTSLYKVKMHKGEKAFAKFPNAPAEVYLHNEDISDLDLGKINIDINYYYELATKEYKTYIKGVN